VRTLPNGRLALDLNVAARVMAFLGFAPEDSEERLEMLIKLKTIHQAVMDQ